MHDDLRHFLHFGSASTYLLSSIYEKATLLDGCVNGYVGTDGLPISLCMFVLVVLTLFWIARSNYNCDKEIDLPEDEDILQEEMPSVLNKCSSNGGEPMKVLVDSEDPTEYKNMAHFAQHKVYHVQKCSTILSSICIYVGDTGHVLH